MEAAAITQTAGNRTGEKRRMIEAAEFLPSDLKGMVKPMVTHRLSPCPDAAFLFVVDSALT